MSILRHVCWIWGHHPHRRARRVYAEPPTYYGQRIVRRARIFCAICDKDLGIGIHVVSESN
jgi:hypothetical protein